MKVRELLQEIERLRKDDFKGEVLTYLATPSDIRSAKPIPGGELKYFVHPGSHGKYIGILVGDVYAGYLNLYRETGYPEPAMSVGSVAVLQKFRGRGIGLALYGVALSILGITLISDESQTPAARKMWQDIATVPGALVRGLLEIEDRDLKHATPDFKNLHLNIPQRNKQVDNRFDQLAELGLNYWGTKSKVHYFEFDVKAGRDELAPAVSNRLSKIYGDESYGTPRLIARWQR